MTKNLIFNNSYSQGQVHSFIYKDPNEKVFTGVALEFDLVIKGKTPEKVEECLMDTIENYLRNVVDNELSEELLNQPADKKYWEKYKEALKVEEKYTEIVLQNKKPNIASLKIPFNIVRADYKNGNFNYA